MSQTIATVIGSGTISIALYFLYRVIVCPKPGNIKTPLNKH